MKKLNILELHRTLNDLNNKQNECFEKIVELCHKRIISQTKMRRQNCFYEVPLYLIGYPIFDIGKCIEYVKKSLEADGFLVKYYFPKFLYISWDLNEIQEYKQPERSKAMLPKSLKEDSLLMNHKSAKNILGYTTVKKSNGKKQLNLL